MIPQRNLSLLSNRLEREGGRRIPEAVLERDYCLAWLLVGLSRSPLRERLAFKGGTAIKRCHFGDYRFSEDLPEGAVVRAYSLDEIAVEKVVALGDRARNEPRDLYDAWYLTSEGHVDLGGLRGGVEGKLEFRGRTLATLGEEFRKKEPRLRKLWSARLAAQMVRLPEFDGVFRALQRSLRRAGLMG